MGIVEYEIEGERLGDEGEVYVVGRLVRVLVRPEAILGRVMGLRHNVLP